MRPSLLSLLFAAALLFQRFERPAASPTGNTEDGPPEQDAFASLLGDDMAEGGLGEGELAAAALAGRSRGQRVIVVAEPGMWRELRALRDGAGAGVYKRRADESGSQLLEHKDQELSIPILRRDTMRCMVGRVYRPCWEV